MGRRICLAVTHCQKAKLTGDIGLSIQLEFRSRIGNFESELFNLVTSYVDFRRTITAIVNQVGFEAVITDRYLPVITDCNCGNVFR